MGKADTRNLIDRDQIPVPSARVPEERARGQEENGGRGREWTKERTGKTR